MAITIPAALDLTGERLAIGDTDAAVTKMNSSWDKLEIYTGQTNQMAIDINALDVEGVVSNVAQYATNAGNSAAASADSAASAASATSTAVNNLSPTVDSRVQTAVNTATQNLTNGADGVSGIGALIESEYLMKWSATPENSVSIIEVGSTSISASHITTGAGYTVKATQDCFVNLTLVAGFGGTAVASASDKYASLMISTAHGASYKFANSIGNFYTNNTASGGFANNFSVYSTTNIHKLRLNANETITFRVHTGTCTVSDQASVVGVPHKLFVSSELI